MHSNRLYIAFSLATLRCPQLSKLLSVVLCGHFQMGCTLVTVESSSKHSNEQWPVIQYLFRIIASNIKNQRHTSLYCEFPVYRKEVIMTFTSVKMSALLKYWKLARRFLSVKPADKGWKIRQNVGGENTPYLTLILPHCKDDAGNKALYLCLILSSDMFEWRFMSRYFLWLNFCRGNWCLMLKWHRCLGEIAINQ